MPPFRQRGCWVDGTRTLLRWLDWPAIDCSISVFPAQRPVRARPPFRADDDGALLRADWQAVGDDLRVVMQGARTPWLGRRRKS